MTVIDHAAAQQIQDALADRCKALVAGDADYLEAILLPEFRHIHATGREEDRMTYLESIRSGRARFSAVAPEKVVFDAYDGAAVAAGDIYIERMVDGEKVGRVSRFVSVWRKREANWKLAFWQMTAKKS